MKKVTYICDRCGTEFEDYEREYRLSESRVDRYGEAHWQFIDLCPECESDLVDIFFKRTRGGGYNGKDVIAKNVLNLCEEIVENYEPAENFDLD